MLWKNLTELFVYPYVNSWDKMGTTILAYFTNDSEQLIDANAKLNIDLISLIYEGKKEYLVDIPFI